MAAADNPRKLFLECIVLKFEIEIRTCIRTRTCMSKLPCKVFASCYH
jgi:hypothetical protein